MCKENKDLKEEKAQLSKEVNSLQVSIKSSKKDLKEATKTFDKKIGDYQLEIKTLIDFKSAKILEEKELKNKFKKVEKKLKNIQEKEAKIKIEKKILRKLKLNM